MSRQTGNTNIHRGNPMSRLTFLKGEQEKKRFCLFSMCQCLDQNDPWEGPKGNLLVKLLEKEKDPVCTVGSNPSF